MDNEKLLSSLSPELRSKAMECKSADELMKLANENNIELSDEQLDAISGGGCSSSGSGCAKNTSAATPHSIKIV